MHLFKRKYFNSEALEVIEPYNNSIKMNSKSVKVLFEKLRQEILHKSWFYSFEDLDRLADFDCLKITGFTRDEFLYISNFLKELNNSPIRTKNQCLAIYLFWLKTGLDQETIEAFCHMCCRWDHS